MRGLYQVVNLRVAVHNQIQVLLHGLAEDSTHSSLVRSLFYP